MALDACFLSFVTSELEEALAGALVEKVYQPSKDEIVLHFRGGQKRKLMISASATAARIHLTEQSVENPKIPPNFCMVLRKHLLGARLTKVHMPAFERVIFLEFDAKNDFFETVHKTLLLEIMGRTSNIILLDDQKKIINAIKLVDFTMTRHREILPGLPYEMPPRQDKTDFITHGVSDTLFERPERELSAAVMDTYAGISPVVAREICYQSVGSTEKRIFELGAGSKKRVTNTIEQVRNQLSEHRWNGCLLIRNDTDKMTEFSFMPLQQYGSLCKSVSMSSANALLEEFYTRQANITRLRQKSNDLLNFLTRTSARIERTHNVRRKELADSENAKTYQIYGQIIQANLHAIQKGDRSLTAQNFYDPELSEVTIPLQPDKTAVQNAQLYFKKYSKAKKGQEIIAHLIQTDEQELEYLDSVFTQLCDAECEEDIEQIRAELKETKYLKQKSGKNTNKKINLSHPREFMTDDGFTVYVGKNNLQNDYITVKLSRKSDFWFHTKDIHGSHALLVTDGTRLEDIPDRTILQAAALCAYYSKGKNDSKVSVDYCPVSHVKKPNGAKPGMVVYDGYYTVVVTPDEALCERTRKK